MCFGCSKEPSHRDGSFEYPQHMFWLRNKKNNFQLHTLIWGPDKNREKHTHKKNGYKIKFSVHYMKHFLFYLFLTMYDFCMQGTFSLSIDLVVF